MLGTHRLTQGDSYAMMRTWASVPHYSLFWTRRTVAIRISRLLEDHMLRLFAKRLARHSLILGSLAAAVDAGPDGRSGPAV